MARKKQQRRRKKRGPKTPKEIAWDWMSRWTRLKAVVTLSEKIGCDPYDKLLEQTGIRKPLETMSDRRHTLDCNWWLDECTCGRPPKEVVDEQVRELTEELRKVNEEKP